jgi:ATP-dependent 26S proteasome regulatory subunit
MFDLQRSRVRKVKKSHFLSSEFDAVVQESGPEHTIKQTQQQETQEVTDPEEVTERLEEVEEDSNETVDHDLHDTPEHLTKRKAPESDVSEFSNVESETEDSVLEEPIRSLRSTSQRSQRYSQHHRLKKRKLRSRESVDYSKQLMPANFTQILDREFKDLQSSSPKKKERQNKRLNESDDEMQPTVFKNRIIALLSKSQHNKHTIVPQNLDDMLRAEEQRLLLHVSSDVRENFMKHRPEFKENSHVGFEMVAGFDEHIMALKEMVGLPLMYPELFSTFHIQPPKGVLFHGPPGMT